MNINFLIDWLVVHRTYPILADMWIFFIKADLMLQLEMYGDDRLLQSENMAHIWPGIDCNGLLLVWMPVTADATISDFLPDSTDVTG